MNIENNINKEISTTEKIISEIKEKIPDLILDDEVTYIIASGGLFRIGKDEEGIYLIGYSEERGKKELEEIRDRLTQELPN